jgi:hypothetical protein
MPSVTAPATSSLLQRLKTSYASGSNLSLSGGQTVHSSDQVLTSLPQTQSPAVQINLEPIPALPATPSEAVSDVGVPNPTEVDIHQHLDVVDRILSEIETEAAAVATQSPVINELSAPTPTESVQTENYNQVEPYPLSDASSSGAAESWPETPQAVVPQALPLAMSQMADSNLNPTHPIGGSATAKERFEASKSPDTSGIDAGGNVQIVEVEANPEIPVEVEGYLQHVEDNQAQLPSEVVITTDVTQPFMPAKPLTPVVVLPITPEIEKVGGSKNPHWSVRWLVEWSKKLMKMFNGSVIYAESKSK